MRTRRHFATAAPTSGVGASPAGRTSLASNRRGYRVNEPNFSLSTNRGSVLS